MQLIDRTVLVTGASSGIGRALAITLAARGCKVVLTGRDPIRLRDVAAETGGAGIEADLSSLAGVKALVDEVRRKHPRLSIIVNNAALQYNYLLADMTDERALTDITYELQTDLAAPIQLAAMLFPTLQREASRSMYPGAVVNVTSGLALAPKKSAAVYCAAKAGLRTFTKALRFQMEASHGEGGPDLRAIEVMLPLVDTPMTAGRGRGKITAAQAADEIIRGIERERNEIYVGKASALRVLHWLAPFAAERMFRNT